MRLNVHFREYKQMKIKVLHDDKQSLLKYDKKKGKCFKQYSSFLKDYQKEFVLLH